MRAPLRGKMQCQQLRPNVASALRNGRRDAALFRQECVALDHLVEELLSRLETAADAIVPEGRDSTGRRQLADGGPAREPSRPQSAGADRKRSSESASETLGHKLPPANMRKMPSVQALRLGNPPGHSRYRAAHKSVYHTAFRPRALHP